MRFEFKQIYSLSKIRLEDDYCFASSYNNTNVLAGEEFSYQIAIKSVEKTEFCFEVNSELSDFVSLYLVRDSVMDMAAYSHCHDDDYITKEPGFMPDILLPLEKQNGLVQAMSKPFAIWVRVNIPRGFKCGIYPINITIKARANEQNFYDNIVWDEMCSTFNVEVINLDLPQQKTLFTQWFYADCIASVHNVSIYSDEHWDLIDKYMHLAAELGINMILTPVITPPLDVEVGRKRPNVQLARITYENGKYEFDFSLLKKWIELAQKNKISHFEISHMFSQWGLKYSPNIEVFEDGNPCDKFGWHVLAKSSEYIEFLKSFIPELVKFLEDEAVLENTYFHLSDEPSLDAFESYKEASDIVKPLIKGGKILDAISNIQFFNEGFMDVPVTAIDYIGPFLESDVKEQWAYYCCAQHEKVSNRFLSMPLYRNRIIGIQMYKADIKGFLHWGYNFYNSGLSKYPINPYVTTSADLRFPSGDAFSVYPTNNGVIPSMRAVVFKEALQDVEVLRSLEKYIGKKAVNDMIDEAAGDNVTFENYPRCVNFVPELMQKVKEKIKSLTLTYN